ncbi:flagellar basal-body MS-ring/collar protein FliF [Salinarimonas soli]|uniref:Flagellar M-ring protein n=1 Tax=Salinarimonas soli TaxID=1638099 RepID=A0A5B2VCT3_9HYPH|nr:flagellar basal-body MS-ring/collar protein FliF [Salinarimonas soli]KAA2236119.1 flagellar M-ring protein FliF [Salinarimonas soli]
MQGILEFLNKLGPQRIAAMGAVTLALVAFFAFVIMRVSQPAMGLLYSELSLQDANAVVKDLEAKGIRYETRAEGTTILVPRNDLPRVRMELAGKGLPSGGGVGYEIFDKGDAFSSTSFVQGINHLRALEGELARTIRAIGRVQSARVHLAIPERRLFDRDREGPRASIALKLAGELEAGQVRAIRHLVASAVEGLKPERVSIVDERGRLLADGAQGDGAGDALAINERQAGLERRLRGQVEEIVAGIVGAGRARIQVAAELESKRVETRSDTFDPESRVVRSTQTRTENQVSGQAEGGVTVGNELPGAQGQGGNGGRDASNKNEEIVNFEISRTTRTEVQEGGRLKRLSVAVLVDGVYTRNPAGETAYQPRSPEELERIAALVRSSIGFDRNRGDQVEVVNLRFAEPPPAPEFQEQSLIASLLAPSREDILRFVELGVIALLTLIVLLTVVRPMVKQIVAPDTRPGKGGAEAIAGGGGLPALAGASPNDAMTAQLMEIAKAQSAEHAASLARVGELARGNAVETVAVLRQWLHEQPK